MGLLSRNMMGLVFIQRFVILKPASAFVLSRLSVSWECSRAVCSRHSVFLVFLDSAYLPFASLRGALGCVDGLAVTITDYPDPSFFGR
jgi:hypothetical protein